MTFKKITVQNFKSIKNVELNYTPGVWKVVGNNNDLSYSSNGSGKTTLLEAVQQCLYNRTTLQVPIEDVSRKSVDSSTTVPYYIEVEFTHNNHTYTVINDRKRMKITVLEDGKDLGLTSIRNSLLKIQRIIGMDFSTFTTLSFITLTTITDLLDNFTSSALMKVILDFNEITDTDKSLKAGLKKVSGKLKDTIRQTKQIEDTIEVLNKYSRIDTSPFHKELATLDAQLSEKQEALQKLSSDLSNGLQTIEDERDARQRLEDLSTGICNCCGSTVAIDTEKLETATQTLQDVLARQVTNESIEEIKRLITALNEEIDVLLEKTSDVKQKLLFADTKNQVFDDTNIRSNDLRKELVELNKEVKRLTETEDVLTTSVSLIKKGSLHKTLLLTFISVLNGYINQFTGFVNLPYISVETIAHKSSVEFVFTDTRFNQIVHINSLSGGEKTRLRLIILLSMLYTINDLTGASSNLLVLDEALDTLDASASEDLARLFEYMVKHDDKFIALVSHGEQLRDITFTGTLSVTKQGGISTLEVL